MIGRLDDYLIHQTARPLAEVASDHPDWQEAIYFNMDDGNGELSAVAGLEVMVNSRYVRAYLYTLHRGEHFSYLYAGPLGEWREQVRAGTLSFAITKPLEAWRLDLADEANGIRTTLEFHARGPVYHYRPIRVEREGQVAIDQTYYTQAGTYGGRFFLGNKTFTNLRGVRARRWGILTLTRLPFYHWIWADLPGRSITAWQFESAAGEILYCDGAVMARDGAITRVSRIEHDWTPVPGGRRPARAKLVLLTDAPAGRLDVECAEIGSHFLGAGSSRWSESDCAALTAADATAISTEEYCEFSVEGERGFGILDVVSLPGYHRYGIAPLRVTAG